MWSNVWLFGVGVYGFLNVSILIAIFGFDYYEWGPWSTFAEDATIGAAVTLAIALGYVMTMAARAHLKGPPPRGIARPAGAALLAGVLAWVPEFVLRRMNELVWHEGWPIQLGLYLVCVGSLVAILNWWPAAGYRHSA